MSFQVQTLFWRSINKKNMFTWKNETYLPSTGPPPKLTMEIHHLMWRCISFWTWGVFQCHIGFQGVSDLPKKNRGTPRVAARCCVFYWRSLITSSTVVEKYMAQFLLIGFLKGPFTNLPFGICAIYFDLKVVGHSKFFLLRNAFNVKLTRPNDSWKPLSKFVFQSLPPTKIGVWICESSIKALGTTIWEVRILEELHDLPPCSKKHHSSYYMPLKRHQEKNRTRK